MTNTINTTVNVHAQESSVQAVSEEGKDPCEGIICLPELPDLKHLASKIQKACQWKRRISDRISGFVSGAASFR